MIVNHLLFLRFLLGSGVLSISIVSVLSDSANKRRFRLEFPRTGSNARDLNS